MLLPNVRGILPRAAMNMSISGLQFSTQTFINGGESLEFNKFGPHRTKRKRADGRGTAYGRAPRGLGGAA